MHDLAPRPPLSRQKASPAEHRKTEKKRQVADGGGGGGWGGGRGSESYDCEKAWPSINHSIQYSLHIYISKDVRVGVFMYIFV